MRIIDPAIKYTHWVPYMSWNWLRATGNVNILGLCVTMSGHISDFHVPMKVKMDSDAIAGLEIGRMTCHKMPSDEHPSIVAASSSSRGSVLKNCLSMNT